jgi:2-desacetyl-2-hydroxyethyl bacteriochlorophyllide A dehydrogenase
MMTNGIIFPEPDKITFGEVEMPEPADGDVVVRTLVTMLSTGTDTRTLRGGQTPHFPLVPGYSALGVVEEAHGDCGPSVGCGRVREGDLVFSGSPKGLTGINRCWGAQVARCVRPAAGLFPLDDRVTPEEYAFTKVAAIALHGVRRSMSRPGDGVLVLGQGLIGQLHARVQAAFGRRVVAADIVPWRLERSLAGGAMRAVNVKEEDLATVVRDVWPEGPQVAVEATARQEGIDLCVDLLRGRAWGGDDRMPTLILQATYPGRLEFDANTFFMKEFVAISTRDTDPRDLVGAACMIGAGGLRVDDLITLKAPPQRAAATFEELLSHPERHMTALFLWE